MSETASRLPTRALEARYYTDPEMFLLERERVFHRTWQPACHSSAIPNPGDRLPFSVIDQDLFVVRQEDGSIRGFHNVCQHRGHTLVMEAGGKPTIVCPYHSWCYNLDGTLRHARGTQSIPGFDRSQISLSEVRTEVLCGFVFVNLDPGCQPMAEAYPGVEDAIRDACPDVENRVLAHEHEAPEHCNWLIAIENYNECYHCRNAHPTFASGVVDPDSYNVSASFPGAVCLHHTAKAQSGESAWYDTSQSDYQSFFLWPSFSLQIYPSRMVNTYLWRPLRADETRVHRGWYSADGAVSEEMQRVIDLDRDTTFAEDLELVRNVQRGMGSKGYRPGFLVISPEEGINSEHSIAKLHQWLRSALDGADCAA